MERTQPGVRTRGGKEPQGPVRQGLVQEEEEEERRAIPCLHWKAAVASSLVVARQRTNVPFLLPKCIPRGELPSIRGHFKRKLELILTNSLETSCRSQEPWNLVIISSSCMAFTLPGIVPRALYTNAFVQLAEFSKPPYDVLGSDVVK